MKTIYAEIEPFVTKDGSVIRELMHPAKHDARHQSLAEATVPVAGWTKLHRHHRAEELYYIVQGRGRMTLGAEEFPVAEGDTISILPGVPHRLKNSADIPLRVLCCSSPSYSDLDTELLDAASDRDGGV